MSEDYTPDELRALFRQVEDDRERRGYIRYELSAEGVRLLAEMGGSLIVRGNHVVIDSTLMPEDSAKLARFESAEFVRGLEDD